MILFYTFVEDYILGRFQRESVNVVDAKTGAAVTLEDLDLLPSLKELLLQKDRPYVKQVYSGGESGSERFNTRSLIALAWSCCCGAYQ